MVDAKPSQAQGASTQLPAVPPRRWHRSCRWMSEQGCEPATALPVMRSQRAAAASTARPAASTSLPAGGSTPNVRLFSAITAGVDAVGASSSFPSASACFVA